MSRGVPSGPPVWCLGLVRAAAWFVPGRARNEWRAKWLGVLSSAWILSQRGEVEPKILQRCCSDCLADMFHGRISRQAIRHLVRSPSVVLTGALLALGVLAVSSHGFSGTRALFRPLPVDDPDRLVRIRYTGAATQPAGVPPRFLPSWEAHSTLLSGIAAYIHNPYAPLARVTPNFFSLLGTKAAQGRVFAPNDRDTAILSDSGRQTLFGLNTPVLGRRLKVEGRDYTVIGVLPDSFWAISPRITVWIPLHLGPQPDPSVPVLIAVVGRMKSSPSFENFEKVRTDLFNAAKAGGQPLPRRPEVVSFTAVTEPQLRGYLVGISFGIAVGAVIVALQQPIRLRHSWRYGWLLAAKTLLLVALPALGWVEIRSAVGGSGPPDSPGVAVAGTVLSIIFMSACALAFWWSFADQRRRCPQCLQLLAMPVTIGSWASVLDPVTTEFLCESGHGSLYLPETEQGEPDHWTALDPSWRELFEKVTPKGS
jgi:MacB-like periplasmic core domain